MMRAHLLVLLTGCALTSKSAPIPIRYFAPPEAVATRLTAKSAIRLRVGRIEPSSALGYAIVRRASDVEIVPYETLRWTERPEQYVRRAVIHAVFDAYGLEQSIAIDANTLDVEVLAFEEVQRGQLHFGRVELAYTLRSGERVVTRGSSASEVSASDPSIEAVVAAIASALDRACADLAENVARTNGTANVEPHG